MSRIDNSRTGNSLRHRVAVHVRSIRVNSGLSQEALSELAGFHRTYVSQVERAVNNITLDNLERIANALGIDASALMQPLA